MWVYDIMVKRRTLKKRGGSSKSKKSASPSLKARLVEALNETFGPEFNGSGSTDKLTDWIDNFKKMPKPERQDKQTHFRSFISGGLNKYITNNHIETKMKTKSKEEIKAIYETRGFQMIFDADTEFGGTFRGKPNVSDWNPLLTKMSDDVRGVSGQWSRSLI